MQWTIYCHTHIESGRRYIGLTKMSMMQRWNRHIYNAFQVKNDKPIYTSHFPNAIRKYGKDAFSHEELAQCRTLEDGNATEELVIEQYETRNPEKGFNLMRGGLHVPHSFKNPWDRSEYREKNIKRSISLIHTPQARINNKNVHNTDEYKERMSFIMKEVCARLEVKKERSNRTISLEVKAKIALANIGKLVSDETRKKIASFRQGKSTSFEIRKRISASLTGKTCSDETRKKLSVSMARRKIVLAVMNC